MDTLGDPLVLEQYMGGLDTQHTHHNHMGLASPATLQARDRVASTATGTGLHPHSAGNQANCSSVSGLMSQGLTIQTAPPPPPEKRPLIPNSQPTRGPPESKRKDSSKTQLQGKGWPLYRSGILIPAETFVFVLHYSFWSKFEWGGSPCAN